MRTNKFAIQVFGILIGLSVIPVLTQDSYILHLVILSMIYGVVASNWNLAIGYGGTFHLAQVPFFAAGSYTSAILVVHIGVSPWTGLLVGGLAAVILSIIVGVPSLRVRGIYLIFLTFSFQFIMHSLVLYFTDITGGALGLILPPYRFGTLVIDMFNYMPAYYMALFLFILSILFVKMVIDSDLGLALVSLRDSELYAVSRGVNPYKSKLKLFVLSSLLAGVSGAFYVHYLRVVTPSILEYALLTTFLGSVVVGGMGTLYGPLIGAFTLTFLSEFLRATALYRNVIFGILMALTLIFLPRGLVTLIERTRTMHVSASSERS